MKNIRQNGKLKLTEYRTAGVFLLLSTTKVGSDFSSNKFECPLNCFCSVSGLYREIVKMDRAFLLFFSKKLAREECEIDIYKNYIIIARQVQGLTM